MSCDLNTKMLSTGLYDNLKKSLNNSSLFIEQYGGENNTKPKKVKAKKAGSKKTGSKKTGSKRAGSKRAGSKRAGSKKAGSKKAGSKKAGSKKAGSKKAGSKKAGSKKTGSKKAGSKKAGSKRSITATEHAVAIDEEYSKLAMRGGSDDSVINTKKTKSKKTKSKKTKRALPEKLLEFQKLVKHMKSITGEHSKFLFTLAKQIRDDITKSDPNISTQDLTKKAIKYADDNKSKIISRYNALKNK